ncbi:terminase large subunit domain-containing protein [Psychromonas hadalis]|uniref:terminase large subunit domain-containing protein n=1 Tax=Psychromonas hadalis TaxID=211669 RepID=UPI000406021F|nr:terminase family protein [Psychromonas hadalis]
MPELNPPLENTNILYTTQQTKALGLYLCQRTANEIAQEIRITDRTVQSWIAKFGWKALRDDAPPEQVTRQRIVYLTWVDEKTDRQLKELDLLLKFHMGNPKKVFHGGNAKDGTNKGRKNNKVKNDISSITKEMLDEYKNKTFFKYQLKIIETKNDPALNWMRFYLKSRQIGLTYLFAFEAFEDAVLTGDNQVFLSASKKQSEIFKNYIRMFALEIGDVDLRGKDEIHLSNGAILNFLSTNARTGQGFNGHLYIDEAFWIPRFKQVDDLIGGVSIHDKWRTTYLSTPSSIGHEAYPKWAGNKADNIDISHEALKDGLLGVDDIYRQMITVDDAIEGGATFFNLKRLHKKYPLKEVFDNLLRCVFLDDAQSAFNVKDLMNCKVDASDWKDVEMDSPRPVGRMPVWIGYDPSGVGDEAAVVVALPPKRKGGAFRLIEKLRLSGVSYQGQADELKALCDKYNVTEIAMDVSGIGGPVSELVEVFFPRVTLIQYSINTKAHMTYKAREVIGAGRLQFDVTWDDVVHAFLMVKRSVTKNSNQPTFTAQRTKDTSHADLAMAIMQLLSLEGINIHQDVTPTVSMGD